MNKKVLTKSIAINRSKKELKLKKIGYLSCNKYYINRTLLKKNSQQISIILKIILLNTTK